MLTNGIVDALESSKNCYKILPLIRTLRPRLDNKHGNSLLLAAIAYNRTFAAIHLITLAAQYDFSSLIMPDRFPTSRSAPLILASKTGNNPVAFFLLSLLAKHSFAIDAQDYLGNTALHYACLMRNNLLVEALLLSGANANIRNHFGVSAFEYYELNILPRDLEYFYGTEPKAPKVLRLIYDWDSSYQGTQNIYFSNYRWFLPHICINLDLNLDTASAPATLFIGDTEYLYKKFTVRTEASIKDLIDLHLQERAPVIDQELYSTMVTVFFNYRASHYEDLCAAKLRESMTYPGTVIVNEDYFATPR